MWIYFRKACMVYLLLSSLRIARATNDEDLIRPNETHLEGVPRIIRQPKPLYYTMKNHPAIVDCVAEPVSYVVVECAEQVIPYRGPDASGRLKVTRLNSANRPDPDGLRWLIEIQIQAKEVEEWFDSYVCHFEVWNKVPFLKRPKKIVSETAVISEAYLKRNFKLRPISTTLMLGQRLEMVCSPPEGRPEPEVYWTKDGIRISLLFPQIQIDGESRLTIEDVKNSDSGNYTCVADLLQLEFRYAHAIVKVLEPVEGISEQQTHYGWMHAREATLCATLLSAVTVVLLVLLVVLAARTKIQQFSAKYWHLNPFCALNPHSKGDYKPASMHSRAKTCYSTKARSPATSPRNNPTHVKNKYTDRPTAIKPDPVSGNYETLEYNEVVIRHALIYSNPFHGYGSYPVTTSSQLPSPSVIPPYSHLNISRLTNRNPYFGHPFIELKIDLPITSAHLPSVDTIRTHYEHLGHADVRSGSERLYDNSDHSQTCVKPAAQSSVYALVPHEKTPSDNCLSSSSSRTSPNFSLRGNGFSGSLHTDRNSIMDDTESQCSIFELNSSVKSAVKDRESRLNEINCPSCPTIPRHQFDIPSAPNSSE
ncbi:Netrin receptor unc5a [Clonorchis sinensis]|uniref:Netrin receptor unc5a n=1 Tax=Clonorchis sinensis TaxID=79923 RepID=A0A8T1M5M6_CLOSI|nr:Netrin receptor unc5a [Clonorchis sinensis]